MRTPDKMSADQSLELIEELQLNEPSEIAKVRKRDAVKVHASVDITPGNASHARRLMEGQAREVCRELLTLTASSPLQVGDVYRVGFDRQTLPLPDSYLLCTACRLLGQDTFESELRFFTPVDLDTLPRGETSD